MPELTSGTVCKDGFHLYGKCCRNEESEVAIVNIGAEEEKGNALVKETFLLKRMQGYQFCRKY